MSKTTDVAVREETGLTESDDGLSLELKIFKQVLGEISTNADQVLAAAKKKSAEYQDIQRFKGHEDLAKKERADVNNAIKRIDEGKKQLKNWWMKPLDDTFAKIDLAKATLKTASTDLDQCVKTVEWEEAQEKKADIQAYFDTKKFDLVPLDRLFNERWLNKTYKMADIKSEINAAVEKIYGDIKILEKIADYGTPAKAFYLETLDMGAAMQKVDNLRAAAEKVAKEQAEREERERRDQVEKNIAEQKQEEKAAPREERIQSLAAEALELPEPEIPQGPTVMEYTLQFRGTREELDHLKQYMSQHGIAYKKLMIFPTDDAAALYSRQHGIAGGGILAAIVVG